MIDYNIYLITDSEIAEAENIPSIVRKSIEGGCGIVQIREKKSSSFEFYNLAITNKLVPGTDFQIIGIDERAKQGQYSEYISKQVLDTKHKISNQLGLPIDQIPFDLGLEIQFGNPTSDNSRTYTVPYSEAINMKDYFLMMSQASNSRIHITELDPDNSDLNIISTAYFETIQGANQSGVVADITFWSNLKQASSE